MKPKHKFNNGDGATLCNHCSKIISTGTTNRVLCNKCLETLVYEYETHNEHGFIQKEIEELIKMFPEFNMDKFNDAMMCNTCILIKYEGKDTIVNYHCDVLTGLRCGIENRDLYIDEFD